jgi:type I restriction enzyme, S subunit
MRDPWPIVRLTEIADIGTGVTLGRDLGNSYSAEYPYLRVANVQDGHIDTSDVKNIRIFPSELARYQLKVGDILLTEGGDFDKLGRGAVWDGRIPICLHQNHIFRVRLRSDFSPHFFSAYMSSAAGRAYFLSCAKQTTNLASINKTQLSAMPVPVPPPGEQHQVAEILASADRLIEQQQRIILKRQLLATALAETLMREASSCPPHQLNAISESAVDGPFGSNLKSEHYAEMPGTRVVRLQNIGTGCFLDDDRAYVENRHAAALSSHDVRGGDLLVASLGDERHPIARACIYPRHLSPGIVKADCFRIRLNPLIATSYYVMQALNSSVLAPVIKASTQGVTRDRINLGSLMSVSLPVPTLDFQNSMKDIIEAEMEVISAAEREVAKLRVEKRGLMNDLLTGRLQVTSM